MNKAIQQQQQKQLHAIQLYRKETGDYSSSNQVAWAKLVKMSQAKYPQVWANIYRNQRISAAKANERMRAANRRHYEATSEYASR